MNFEQIEKLILAGFTKEDIVKLFNDFDKKEEPEKKKEEPEKKKEEPEKKKEEVEPWKQAFSAMSESITQLSEAVKAIQGKKIDNDEQPNKHNETVDDIISYMFCVDDDKKKG